MPPEICFTYKATAGTAKSAVPAVATKIKYVMKGETHHDETLQPDLTDLRSRRSDRIFTYSGIISP